MKEFACPNPARCPGKGCFTAIDPKCPKCGNEYIVVEVLE